MGVHSLYDILSMLKYRVWHWCLMFLFFCVCSQCLFYHKSPINAYFFLYTCFLYILFQFHCVIESNNPYESWICDQYILYYYNVIIIDHVLYICCSRFHFLSFFFCTNFLVTVSSMGYVEKRYKFNHLEKWWNFIFVWHFTQSWSILEHTM